MAQIKKKFIQEGAVDGTKILLLNNQALRAKLADGSSEDVMKVDASGVLKLLKLPQLSVDPVATADVARKGYVDAQVLAEQTARISAVSAEQTARTNADEALDGRLDIIEGADNVVGSVAKSLKDAKAYADQKVTDLIGGSVQALDTLKELADALGNDASFSATVANNIGALDGRLDIIEGADTVSGSILKAVKDSKAYADGIVASLSSGSSSALTQEISDRQAADVLLDGRLDIIEGSGAGSVAKAQTDAQSFATSAVAAEAALRVSAVSAEASARQTADQGLSASIAQEISDRQTAVTAEATARASAISSEASTRSTADGLMAGRLNVLEGSGVGSVAKAQADAQTFATGIMTTEQGVRLAADNALDARLDIIEGDVSTAGSILKAKADAISSSNGYTDGKITDLIGGAPELLNTLKELADQLALDESGVASLTTTVANNLQTAKNYADAAVLVETNARVSAVSSEASSRSSADTALGGRIDTEISDRQTAVTAEATARASAVSAEATSRTNADNALGTRIDNLNTSQVAENVGFKYFTDGRAQTAAVVNLMSGGETVKAPSVYSVKAYVDAADLNLQDQIDDVNAAITDIQSDVADLQAKAFQKQKFVLSAGNISAGYVDLNFAVVENSLHVFTNSLFLGQSDDYTVSVVGGVTRVTFYGDFAVGGASALEAGDSLYIQYQK